MKKSITAVNDATLVFFALIAASFTAVIDFFIVVSRNVVLSH